MKPGWVEEEQLFFCNILEFQAASPRDPRDHQVQG